MKLLCISGVPHKGLHSGSVYTEVDTFFCCGHYIPPRLTSVAEATGHVDAMHCNRCGVDVPAAATGWFDSSRFIPWDPPEISSEEIEAVFEQGAGRLVSAGARQPPLRELDRVFLSRRNLLTLLFKLDRMARGEVTACTIFKLDNRHPRFPQTMRVLQVTAVEDGEYYVHRRPGEMHPNDDPQNPERKE